MNRANGRKLPVSAERFDMKLLPKNANKTPMTAFYFREMKDMSISDLKLALKEVGVGRNVAEGLRFVPSQRGVLEVVGHVGYERWIRFGLRAIGGDQIPGYSLMENLSSLLLNQTRMDMRRVANLGVTSNARCFYLEWIDQSKELTLCGFTPRNE